MPASRRAQPVVSPHAGWVELTYPAAGRSSLVKTLPWLPICFAVGISLVLMLTSQVGVQEGLDAWPAIKANLLPSSILFSVGAGFMFALVWAVQAALASTAAAARKRHLRDVHVQAIERRLHGTEFSGDEHDRWAVWVEQRAGGTAVVSLLQARPNRDDKPGLLVRCVPQDRVEARDLVGLSAVAGACADRAREEEAQAWQAHREALTSAEQRATLERHRERQALEDELERRTDAAGTAKHISAALNVPLVTAKPDRVKDLLKVLGQRPWANQCPGSGHTARAIFLLLDGDEIAVWEIVSSRNMSGAGRRHYAELVDRGGLPRDSGTFAGALQRTSDMVEACRDAELDSFRDHLAAERSRQRQIERAATQVKQRRRSASGASPAQRRPRIGAESEASATVRAVRDAVTRPSAVADR